MSSKILGVVLSLITLLGSAFTVEHYFVSKADAAEQQEQLKAGFLVSERKLTVQAERDRLESDLQTTRLEIAFLEDSPWPINAKDKEKKGNRLKYLRQREVILEDRLLKLRDKQ